MGVHVFVGDDKDVVRRTASCVADMLSHNGYRTYYSGVPMPPKDVRYDESETVIAMSVAFVELVKVSQTATYSGCTFILADDLAEDDYAAEPDAIGMGERIRNHVATDVAASIVRCGACEWLDNIPEDDPMRERVIDAKGSSIAALIAICFVEGGSTWNSTSGRLR